MVISMKIDDHDDLALFLRRYMLFGLIATLCCQTDNNFAITICYEVNFIPNWNPPRKMVLIVSS